MSSHDTRVVEMRFDNAQFEKGIKESMKTLDEFEKNLKFDKVERSLSGLEKSVNSVSFGGIKKGIDDVVTGFNALGIAGVMAMTKIASSIVNAGHQIASSFIEPMRSGFQEYETQINAVQTILTNTSSKGTTIDDVNKALDELNVYADKTIYNFTQMTDNIGRFTAAGVGLEDSVTAIKGISNLAAASGADSAQAARAMYNLSQAISMGKLQLMDWNSVVNAGMGGELFQESLKETARVHGVAVDEIIAKNGSFRDSLSEGWITSEILLETLSKFTGDLTEDQLKSLGYTEQQIKGIMDLGTMANDAATKVKTYTQLMDTLKEENQSGWTQSWEIIIGDYEEAKKLWSDIARITTGVIGEQSQARNSFLESVFGGPSGLITADRWIEFMRDGKAAENSAFFDALQKTVEKSGISIDDLREKYGSFMAAVASGEVVTEKMVEDTINGVTQTSTQSLDQIKEIVNQIENGFFGNGEERRKALEEAGYSYEALQALVDADWNGYGFGNLDWENLTEDQLRNLGVTEEQIVAFEELKKQMGVKGSDVDNLLGGSGLTGREMLVNSITNVIQAGADALHLFGEVWNEVFPPAGPEGIKNALEAVMHFTEQFQLFTRTYDEETGKLLNVEITDFGKKVKTIFTGIADGFGIIFDAISAVADFFKGIFESVFGEIFSDSEALNPIDFLVKYAEGISQLRDDLKSGEFIPKLIENIKNAINDLGEAARKVMDPIKALFTDGNGGISTAGKIGGVLGLLLAVMAPIIGRGLMGGGLVAGGGAGLLGLAAVGGIIGLLVSGLIGKDENGKSALDRLKEGDYGAFGIGEIIRGKFSGLGEAFRNLGDTLNFHPIDSIRNLFGSIRDSDVGQAIGGFVSNVKQKFTDFFSGIDFNPGEALSNIVNGIAEFFSGIDINFDWFNGENGLLSKFGQVKDWIEGKLEGSPLDINFDWFNGENGIVSKINQYIIEPISNLEFDFSWFNGPNGLLSKFRQFKSWIEGKVTGSSLDINFDWFNGEDGLVGLIQKNVITPLSSIEFNFDWFNGEGGFLSKFRELKLWIEGKSEDEETSANVDFGLINTFKTSIDDLFTWFGSLGSKTESGEEGTSVKEVLDSKFNEIKSSVESFMASDAIQGILKFFEKAPILIGLIVAGWAGTALKSFFTDLATSIREFLNQDSNGTAYFKFVAIATGITELCGALYMVRDLDMNNIKEGLGAIFGSLGALMSGTLFTSLISGKFGGAFNIGTAIAELGLALAIQELAKVIKEIAEQNLTPKQIATASAVMTSLTELLAQIGVFTGGASFSATFKKSFGIGAEIEGVDASTGFGDLLIAKAIELLAKLVLYIRDRKINEYDALIARRVLEPMSGMLTVMSAISGGFTAFIGSGGLSVEGASWSSGTGMYLYSKAIGVCVEVIQDINNAGITVAEANMASEAIFPMVAIIEGVIALNTALKGGLDILTTKVGGTKKGALSSIIGEFADTAQFAVLAKGIQMISVALKGLQDVKIDDITPAIDKLKELFLILGGALVVGTILEFATKAKYLGLALSGMVLGVGMFMNGIAGVASAISGIASTYMENIDKMEGGTKSLSGIIQESVEGFVSGLSSDVTLEGIQKIIDFFGEHISGFLTNLVGEILASPVELGAALGEALSRIFLDENGANNDAIELTTNFLESVANIFHDGPSEENIAVFKNYWEQWLNALADSFMVAVANNEFLGTLWDVWASINDFLHPDEPPTIRASEIAIDYSQAHPVVIKDEEGKPLNLSLDDSNITPIVFIDGVPHVQFANGVGDEISTELIKAYREDLDQNIYVDTEGNIYVDTSQMQIKTRHVDTSTIVGEIKDNIAYKEINISSDDSLKIRVPIDFSAFYVTNDDTGEIERVFEYSDLTGKITETTEEYFEAALAGCEPDLESTGIRIGGNAAMTLSESMMYGISSMPMDNLEFMSAVNSYVTDGVEYSISRAAPYQFEYKGKKYEVKLAPGDVYQFIMEGGTGIQVELPENMEEGLVLTELPEGFLKPSENDINKIFTVVAEGIDTSEADALFEPLGRGIDEGTAAGIDSNVGVVSESMYGVIDTAVKSGDEAAQHNSPAKVFIPLGESIPEGIAVGINQGGSYLIGAFTNMVSASIIFLAQFPPQFQQHGLDVTSNIAWGINIGGGTIASALYNMHSSMLIVLGNLSSGFREAGENFTAGLAIGIRSGTSLAIDAAAHVATMALNTAKNTLQEKSPSQATRLMGRFFSQGLGLGVRDDEKFAVGSAQHLGNSMINAMRTTARLVDAVMNDELNMTPTISPIIDMSNLQNANDLMNGAFRSRSVALAYNASMTTDGLVNPFDRLIERLDAKNDFGNTSIYMDGAVLNDDEEMRAVTLDFLYGLKRKAAL